MRTHVRPRWTSCWLFVYNQKFTILMKSYAKRNTRLTQPATSLVQLVVSFSFHYAYVPMLLLSDHNWTSSRHCGRWQYVRSWLVLKTGTFWCWIAQVQYARMTMSKCRPNDDCCKKMQSASTVYRLSCYPHTSQGAVSKRNTNSLLSQSYRYRLLAVSRTLRFPSIPCSLNRVAAPRC